MGPIGGGSGMGRDPERAECEPNGVQESLVKYYIATKVVGGIKMTLGLFHAMHPGQKFPGDAKDEGYLVIYPQVGEEKPYHGWCPKAQFEAQNHDIVKGISFSHAMEFLRRGKSVKRIGSAKTYVLGKETVRDIDGNFVKETLILLVKFDEPSPADYAEPGHLKLPRIVRTEQVESMSRDDILADDWVVL